MTIRQASSGSGVGSNINDPDIGAPGSVGSVCMKIRKAYTQWAVGEGFFHSGWTSVDERKDLAVVHVFDCGAQRKFQAAPEREITEFRLRHKHLDLLFISHFHFDHVSGLERLLSGQPARHIIAPLLPPEQRILVLAQALSDGLGPADWPDWYPRLIANPRAVLAELSPETPITWVAPQETLEAQATPLGRYEDFSDAGPIELSLPQPSVGASSLAAQSQLRHSNQPVWMWVPWLPQAFSSHADRFRKILAAKLPDDLRDLGNPRALNKVVVDHQKDLVAAYEQVLLEIRESAAQPRP